MTKIYPKVSQDEMLRINIGPEMMNQKILKAYPVRRSLDSNMLEHTYGDVLSHSAIVLTTKRGAILIEYMGDSHVYLTYCKDFKPGEFVFKQRKYIFVVDCIEGQHPQERIRECVYQNGDKKIVRSNSMCNLVRPNNEQSERSDFVAARRKSVGHHYSQHDLKNLAKAHHKSLKVNKKRENSFLEEDNSDSYDKYESKYYSTHQDNNQPQQASTFNADDLDAVPANSELEASQLSHAESSPLKNKNNQIQGSPQPTSKPPIPLPIKDLKKAEQKSHKDHGKSSSDESKKDLSKLHQEKSSHIEEPKDEFPKLAHKSSHKEHSNDESSKQEHKRFHLKLQHKGSHQNQEGSSKDESSELEHKGFHKKIFGFAHKNGHSDVKDSENESSVSENAHKSKKEHHGKHHENDGDTDQENPKEPVRYDSDDDSDHVDEDSDSADSYDSIYVTDRQSNPPRTSEFKFDGENPIPRRRIEAQSENNVHGKDHPTNDEKNDPTDDYNNWSCSIKTVDVTVREFAEKMCQIMKDKQYNLFNHNCHDARIETMRYFGMFSGDVYRKKPNGNLVTKFFADIHRRYASLPKTYESANM